MQAASGRGSSEGGSSQAAEAPDPGPSGACEEGVGAEGSTGPTARPGIQKKRTEWQEKGLFLATQDLIKIDKQRKTF